MLLAVAFVWGITFVFIKGTQEEIGPFTASSGGTALDISPQGGVADNPGPSFSCPRRSSLPGRTVDSTWFTQLWADPDR